PGTIAAMDRVKARHTIGRATQKEIRVNFRIDDISRLPAWEFTVQIGGKKYPTRPLTMADVEQLQSLTASPKYAHIRKWFIGVFVKPRPDLQGCRPEMVLVMCQDLLAYWKKYCE